MAEHDVIVRCPGCGNGKVVSVAVGQLLQCDVCRTAFHAPIASDDQCAPNALADSFVVGEPAAPGKAATQEPAVTSSAVTSDAVTSGSSSGLDGSGSNIKRTRVWRSHDLEAAPESDHAPLVVQPDLAASSPESDSDEELDISAPPGMFWTVVGMLAVGVMLTVLVVAGFVIVRGLGDSQGKDSQGKQPSTARTRSHDADAVAAHWTDAAKFSQRIGPISLKVERVIYGKLRAKDRTNQVITTEDDNLLGITVSAHNQGHRLRDFQNWYGHAFVADDGAEMIAELTDDQGRSYALLKFDDVSHIEGQRLADQLGPDESVQDTVVFMIPDDVDRSVIKYFRLTLPGAAVGLAEFFRFQIPVRMIRGFDRGATEDAEEA